jgi:polyhydroxyalkanoate synthase
MSADEWEAATPKQEGSWWPAWQAWLVRHSDARRVKPPPLGTRTYPALADAPGNYVLQR